MTDALPHGKLTDSLASWFKVQTRRFGPGTEKKRKGRESGGRGKEGERKAREMEREEERKRKGRGCSHSEKESARSASDQLSVSRTLTPSLRC